MFGMVGLENEPEHNRDQRYQQYNHLFDLIGLFRSNRAARAFGREEAWSQGLPPFSLSFLIFK